MNQHLPGQKTVQFICGYAGDKHQMEALMPVYEHHQIPIVFLSPADSPVHGMGPHICRPAGKRAYIGQDSLDRQYEHFKIMLEYKFDWYLANDSDSFVVTPELPSFLYADKNTLWGNVVDDFRVNMKEFGPNFHKPLPQIAIQPPYFFSRNVLEKFVATCSGIVACPTTPFLDWYFVQCCDRAHVKHARYPGCASCETVTDLGRAVMKECIQLRNATFLHAIKTKAVMEMCVNTYKSKR